MVAEGQEPIAFGQWRGMALEVGMAIGAKGNKVAVSPDRYELQLKRQLGFLEKSCRAFDAGDADEAIRIALALRVFLHDTPHSTSLLTHLGIKMSLNYVDTGVYRHLLKANLDEWVKTAAPGKEVFTHSPSDVGLVELGDAGEGRAGWYAPLRFGRWMPDSPFGKATPGFSSFDSWWRTALVEGTSGASFSRWDLVNIMANQDGGGHVDAALDADYQDLEIDHLGVFMAHGVQPQEGVEPRKALNNVAFASVRQIAFELQQTLARYEYAKATPGVLALRDPYCSFPTPPKPPHTPLHYIPVIGVGRPA